MRQTRTPAIGDETRWVGEVVGDDIEWRQVTPPVEGQLSLEDMPDTAGPVRSTDPATSEAAAAQPGRSTLRQRVLIALLTYGAMSDEEIAGVLGEQDRKDSVSKRRSELRDAGLVEDTGERTTTRRGSSTIVWRLTGRGHIVAFGNAKV